MVLLNLQGAEKELDQASRYVADTRTGTCMFDLDKEIHAWCRSIHSNGWKRASSHAELMDHLYCEVERLSEEGLSEIQAFLAATERMGTVEDLRIEHSKNRNLLSTFSDFLLPKSRLQTKGADRTRLGQDETG